MALLRGVNVGGRRPVAMADLRELCGRLGLADAQTLLQSGNIVFRGGGRKGSTLERLLEAEAEKRLGVQTAFFVRSATEWKSVVAANPFREEADRDPSHLLVLCLKDAVAPGAAEALRAAIQGPERVHVRGREAYIVYPNGIGRSPVTNALVEKKLGTPATGRNWNTVLKLDALARA